MAGGRGVNDSRGWPRRSDWVWIILPLATALGAFALTSWTDNCVIWGEGEACRTGPVIGLLGAGALWAAWAILTIYCFFRITRSWKQSTSTLPR